MVLRFKWESRSPPFLKVLPRKFLPRKGDRLAGEDFFYGFPRPPSFPVLILCNKAGRGSFPCFIAFLFFLFFSSSMFSLTFRPDNTEEELVMQNPDVEDIFHFPPFPLSPFHFPPSFLPGPFPTFSFILLPSPPRKRDPHRGGEGSGRMGLVAGILCG